MAGRTRPGWPSITRLPKTLSDNDSIVVEGVGAAAAFERVFEAMFAAGVPYV
jgi:hypothetical protein